jgi:predicted O-methyltransferase YrrM
LAEGLQTGGRLTTIDINEENRWLALKYFDKSNNADRIDSLVGNALEIIPKLQTPFDLVFIDADKENYSAYFDLIVPKLNPGALIMSDNVLWSGKVVESLDPKDFSTKALLDYNKKINVDPRVETVLFPIRDGLSLTRVL